MLGGVQGGDGVRGISKWGESHLEVQILYRSVVGTVSATHNKKRTKLVPLAAANKGKTVTGATRGDQRTLTKS